MNIMLPILVSASVLAAAPAMQSIAGRWVNPADTVEVDLQPCGSELCGRVVWASSEAQSDARDGGTAQLVGTELLRGYRETAPGRWTGQVFVPEVGQTFSSRMVELGPKALRISGCEIGHLLCRGQTWHRAGQ